MNQYEKLEDFWIRLLKEIEKAGKHIYKYWQVSLKYDVDFKVNNVQDFLKNNVKAIKWFCGQTFFAGRDDLLSDTYRRAFFLAFDQTFADHIDGAKILNQSDRLIARFRDNVQSIRRKDNRTYKIRSKDEVAIKSALEFIKEKLGLYDFNPVYYLKDKIEKGEVRDFFEHTEIPQVGIKLKRLIVRDITVWYNLHPTIQDLQFMFPVDAWVRKLCKLMWSETANMNDEELASYLSDRLEHLRISPIYFNAGLWALGWYGRKPIELLLEKHVYPSPNVESPEISRISRVKLAKPQLTRLTDKRKLELEGKHAVLEKLKRMGYDCSLSVDFHPKIIAYNPKTGKTTQVWVKTTRDKNLMPIGKYTKEQMKTKFTLPTVFVKVDHDGTKRFYVIPAKDLLPLIEKGYNWWLREVEHRKKNLAPFDEQSQGIFFRYLQNYENRWENLGIDLPNLNSTNLLGEGQPTH
jgi:hypothetical protein